MWKSILGGMAVGAINNIASTFMGNQAREQNYQYGEMAAENADKRTRALYTDFYSIPAQMKQLKDAGLSPSVFYGDMAGAAGQSGAMGTGAAGYQNQVYGIEPLQIAQIKNLNADTAKKQAEAETERGDNKRGIAEIAEIWSKKGLNDASTALTNADASLRNIQLYIDDNTKDFSISRIKYESQKAEHDAWRAYWEAEKSHLDWDFDFETFEKRKEELANQCAELAARTALHNANKELSEAEKNAIRDYVNIAMDEAQAHADSAAAYGEWVELMTDQMPKQLELRGKEIGLEKWRIGVDAFNNLIRTAGYVFGASQLGDGGTQTTDIEETERYDQYGHGHADKKTTRTTTKTRLPKRIK